MSKRTSIPDDPTPFGQAVKQTLDRIAGQQKNTPRLAPLPATASLADVIARVNTMLERMQGE